jgi:copper chaperone CopZ
MSIRSLRLMVLATGLLASGCFRPDIRTAAIGVPGMTSEDDAKRVRDILEVYRQLGMVGNIETDISNRIVRVTYDSTMVALKNLEFVISYAGYDAGETPARRLAANAEPKETP